MMHIVVGSQKTLYGVNVKLRMCFIKVFEMNEMMVWFWINFNGWSCCRVSIEWPKVPRTSRTFNNYGEACAKQYTSGWDEKKSDINSLKQTEFITLAFVNIRLTLTLTNHLFCDLPKFNIAAIRNFICALRWNVFKRPIQPVERKQLFDISYFFSISNRCWLNGLLGLSEHLKLLDSCAWTSHLKNRMFRYILLNHFCNLRKLRPVNFI